MILAEEHAKKESTFISLAMLNIDPTTAVRHLFPRSDVYTDRRSFTHHEMQRSNPRGDPLKQEDQRYVLQLDTNVRGSKNLVSTRRNRRFCENIVHHSLRKNPVQSTLLPRRRNVEDRFGIHYQHLTTGKTN